MQLSFKTTCQCTQSLKYYKEPTSNNFMKIQNIFLR